MNKAEAIRVIDEKQALLDDVNDSIWEYAETAFQEFKSMDKLCEALEQEGFKVEKGVGDIPTAFTGTYGHGKPVIGLLGEFDALSGLSQVGGCPEKKALVPGAAGHGCGHNCLGTASLAAAIAVKNYLEHNLQVSGTVIYFGCPGEEGGSGKAFMAREGVFKDLDAAITWHPSSTNNVTSGSSLANYQVKYRFYGTSAHAAGDPHLGRSALDAVELMNVGVQFLREHMIDEARVHYAILDAGGYSPNVVQPYAEVLYLIRSPKNSQVEELYQRVNKIAQGAALMTETRMEMEFIKGCSNTIPNNVLEAQLYENFKEIGVPKYTPEEHEFARQIIAHYEAGPNAMDGAAGTTKAWGKELAEYQAEHGVSLNDFLLSLQSYDKASAGSTDVGDVSWNCPTAQIHVVTTAAKTPGHSWQFTSCNRTSIAHKGVNCAGKVMGATVIDLIENPEIIKKANEEFLERLGGETYKCPIPAGIKPQAINPKK
ncbi:M20 family metallopeptidase [Intestinimonas sp. MSJ-38]|uniref:M20 family metallopeptidase n=1 Tax=Intestinimonas sp. MSJ-38 TaxID=2841532 RepID=UPI001C117A2B|nr:M20 family metallopeptidase [Intestinimonas sp. MSJ-38]MBU5433337.1 amidohydrolase [Intestinimonas sp. MSJ-38]